MRIIITFLILFFMASCGLENSNDLQKPAVDNKIQQEFAADLIRSSKLAIRNATRADVFYIPYNVISKNSCEIIMESNQIPYFFIFTNNPVGKSAVIKDQKGEIIQIIPIDWNEYEKIWQTGNVYFQTGTNTIEISSTNVEVPQTMTSSLAKRASASQVLPAFNFLSLGGWKIYVEGDPYGNFKIIKYNMWMDFIISNVVTPYEIKVKIVNGPSQIKGKEYAAIRETPLNGVTKYGIDIVDGAGFNIEANGVPSYTGNISFNLYINKCLVKTYTYDLINTVNNNTRTVPQVTWYFNYGPGTRYDYLGLDENIRQQVFLQTTPSGVSEIYRVPFYATSHDFIDGYYKTPGNPIVFDYLTNYNTGIQLLFLQGINTTDLKIYNPYYNNESNQYNTSIDSTETIVHKMVAWSPPFDQILIAHSHGGMRGLAYINEMGANANRIKGFISIDSPLKGFEGLRGGTVVMGQKVSHEVDTLVNGGYAILNAIPFGIIIEWLVSEIRKSAEAIADDLSLTRGTPLADIVNTARGKTPSMFSEQVLNEMDPQGYFAQKYLGASANGSNFSKIIPSNVLVGQIVGMKNDPLYYLGNEEDDAYKNVIDVKRNISTGLGVTEGFLIAIGTTYMLIPGMYPLGLWYYYQALNAGLALDWVNNYTNYFGDLLGDRQNDSLTAVYSQSRTNDDLGGTPISLNYYQEVPNMIHSLNKKIASDVHPKVWGVGGGMQTKTISATANTNYGTPIIWGWFEAHKHEGWIYNNPNKMYF